MKRVFKKDYELINRVKDLLSFNGLALDNFIDEIYLIRDENGKAVGTGSIYGNVLKCIAIRKDCRGHDTLGKIIGFLVNRCYELGITHLFIYTKIDNYKSFEYFGFKKIARTEKVVLLENKIDGISIFLEKLIQNSPKGFENVSSIVLNCNPFTNGHLYLIKKASENSDWVHIFILWENLSTFSNTVRYKLVCEGLKDIKNISIHKGENYIISKATFPSYFIHDKEELINEQIQLDLNIFSELIAPTLNITSRYIGEEPFSYTTNLYNQMMKIVLPERNIEVIELKRKEFNYLPISASEVRNLLQQKNFSKLKELVPITTYNYLTSL